MPKTLTESRNEAVRPASTGSPRSNSPQARNIRGGNFAWTEKSALALIQTSFSDSNNVPSALAVYTALVWLASDHGDKPFQQPKGLIAHRAGVSIRTATSVLKAFESMGLVHIERQKAPSGHPDAPNCYTLLPVGNGCRPPGNDCTPLRNGHLHPSGADKLKIQKSNNKERDKSADANNGGFPTPALAVNNAEGNGTDEEFYARLERENPEFDIPDEIRRIQQHLRKTKGPSAKLTRDFILRWFRNADRRMIAPPKKPNAPVASVPPSVPPLSDEQFKLVGAKGKERMRALRDQIAGGASVSVS